MWVSQVYICSNTFEFLDSSLTIFTFLGSFTPCFSSVELYFTSKVNYRKYNIYSNPIQHTSLSSLHANKNITPQIPKQNNHFYLFYFWYKLNRTIVFYWSMSETPCDSWNWKVSITYYSLNFRFNISNNLAPCVRVIQNQCNSHCNNFRIVTNRFLFMLNSLCKYISNKR